MGNADRLSEAIAGLEGEGTMGKGAQTQTKNINSRTYSSPHSPKWLYFFLGSVIFSLYFHVLKLQSLKMKMMAIIIISPDQAAHCQMTNQDQDQDQDQPKPCCTQVSINIIVVLNVFFVNEKNQKLWWLVLLLIDTLLLFFLTQICFYQGRWMRKFNHCYYCNNYNININNNNNNNKRNNIKSNNIDGFD